MDEKGLVLIVCLIAAALICLFLLFLERRRTRKTMEALSSMLDSAINGDFDAQGFDESLLSSVGNKFSAYLTASVVAERNIKAEKDKIKELLADISHQTKTPISNILLYAQLLGEQDLPEEGKDCAAALSAQAEKLSFLISSLVKLSRLEAGVIRPCPVFGPVFSMLSEAARQLRDKAEQKGVELSVEETDAFALFDPKWTREALCNLLDNAVKYTPPDGSVRVSVKSYEMFCRIDVSDTGIGIAEEERAKVFKRFYRSPSVRDTEGAGIGLYLTREILASQGGYIKLERGGKGAVFSVFLPRGA